MTVGIMQILAACHQDSTKKQSSEAEVQQPEDPPHTHLEAWACSFLNVLGAHNGHQCL
jgi:hypothetical protein